MSESINSSGVSPIMIAVIVFVIIIIIATIYYIFFMNKSSVVAPTTKSITIADTMPIPIIPYNLNSTTATNGINVFTVDSNSSIYYPGNNSICKLDINGRFYLIDIPTSSSIKSISVSPNCNQLYFSTTNKFYIITSLLVGTPLVTEIAITTNFTNGIINCFADNNGVFALGQISSIWTILYMNQNGTNRIILQFTGITNTPIEMTIDNNNNIYVLTSNSYLYIIPPNTLSVPNPILLNIKSSSSSWSITCDAKNNIYISNTPMYIYVYQYLNNTFKLDTILFNGNYINNDYNNPYTSTICRINKNGENFYLNTSNQIFKFNINNSVIYSDQLISPSVNSLSIFLQNIIATNPQPIQLPSIITSNISQLINILTTTINSILLYEVSETSSSNISAEQTYVMTRTTINKFNSSTSNLNTINGILTSLIQQLNGKSTSDQNSLIEQSLYIIIQIILNT
jgi:hypothetical protein